jgi:hypothetical protein
MSPCSVETPCTPWLNKKLNNEQNIQEWSQSPADDAKEDGSSNKADNIKNNEEIASASPRNDNE